VAQPRDLDDLGSPLEAAHHADRRRRNAEGLGQETDDGGVGGAGDGRRGDAKSQRRVVPADDLVL
jgi:hypothetical protein